MKRLLQDGPFTTCVMVDDVCWRNYKEGIITKSDNCGEFDWINHAVTVVGLGYETITLSSHTTPDVYETKCKRKKIGKCKKGWKIRQKRGRRHCCKRKLVEKG